MTSCSCFPCFKKRNQSQSYELEDQLTETLTEVEEPGTVRNVVSLTVFQTTLFEIYIQGLDHKLHAIRVPESEAENYSMYSLRKKVKELTGQNLTNKHRFSLRGQTIVEKNKQGKYLTLKECGVKPGDTLILKERTRIMLKITDPKVDVCFLVDCTRSMSGHIEAVKNNVKSLRDNLMAKYRGCDLHFAFVRYTDYDQSELTRITWIDFTTEESSFHSFVSAIKADGGGDTAEDIMGGLEKTFEKLSWRSQATKVLIHFADSPCHGNQYHAESLGDDYPGGDPAGISHESMMQQVIRLEIQYWFGYINKQHTDQMIGVFNQSLSNLSDQRYLIRQFDAVEPTEVGEAIHRSVTDSIACHSATTKGSSSGVRNFTLKSEVPTWSTINEEMGKKTSPPGLKQLADLDSLKLEQPSVLVSLKIAPSPFALGTESLVYHAYDCNNDKRMVLKQFKKSARKFNTLDCYMKKLEIHTIASAYAREFNADERQPGSACSFEFAPLDVVHFPGGPLYLMEPFISGKIVKFNNNTGVVVVNEQDSETFQAFSHFTWVKSGETLLVCDLQGSRDGDRVLLTDPTINSERAEYGHIDVGIAGVQKFFKSHICSTICQEMKLESYSL